MCMVGDADSWDAWFGEDTLTARKRHRCGECDRTIAPGEKYLRATAVMDGSFFVAKTCADCADAPRAWLEEHCDGWLYNALLMDLEEHIDQFPDDRVLMEAVYGMRSQWGRRDPGLYEAIA